MDRSQFTTKGPSATGHTDSTGPTPSHTNHNAQADPNLTEPNNPPHPSTPTPESPQPHGTHPPWASSPENSRPPTPPHPPRTPPPTRPDFQPARRVEWKASISTAHAPSGPPSWHSCYSCQFISLRPHMYAVSQSAGSPLLLAAPCPPPGRSALTQRMRGPPGPPSRPRPDAQLRTGRLAT